MLTTVTSRIVHTPEVAEQPRPLRSWVWPLPRLDGLSPCVLEDTSTSPPGEIEIGYPSRCSSSSYVPVLAAYDGVIAYAGSAAGNCTLCLDHAGGWLTQYSDLEHLLVRPTDRFHRRRKERVQGGDVIGHVRRSALRIRFGLSELSEQGCVALDPTTRMHAWSVLPWFAEPACGVAARAAG